MDINPLNLVAALNELDALTRTMKTSCRAALKESLRPMVDAYRSNLSSHVGNQPAVKRDRAGRYVPRPMRLAQSPSSRVWAFPDGTGYAGLVGPRSGAAPHAHLIERGTVARFRKKIGGKYWLVEVKIQRTGSNFRGLKPPDARRAGTMPAFSPLRRAFDTTNEIALGIFRDVYAARMTNKGYSV